MTARSFKGTGFAGLLALALAGPAAAAETETAVFAGRCFWCVEKAFDVIDGVVDHKAGFAGGHVKNPTYDEVTAGSSATGATPIPPPFLSIATSSGAWPSGQKRP